MANKDFMSLRKGTEKLPDTGAGAGRGFVNPTYVGAAGNGRGIVNSTFTESSNNFIHETNNIITTPTSTDFEKINLNTAFQPNILDNYDVVTYHWKFFIVDNEASSTGNILNLNSQIIIAESGVSDLTIDRVEINSIATPSIESGTGTSTTVKFEIVEPAGAGLIDKIFYQSLALGIGNWNVMPFYLQLQFKGRTPDTSEADDGSPGAISSLRWIWALKISNIKANVTTVGTRYEFSAIIYNELAQSNAYFTLQHSTVLSNLSTFSDAMKKLQDKLNEDQYYKLIANNSIPDSYKIIIDPKLSQYRITPINNNTNSIRNNNTVTFEGKDATFPAATSIDKIIDSLLSQTDEYQTSMLGASTPGSEGKTMIAEESQMKKFWRIITESRPVKFDPRRNDYAREFSIFVVEYDIGILDANTFQDTSPPLTLETERKRLMTYVKKSILKKKYNYIFTGLNDQIINFDIKINNAFASAVSRMGGIYYNSAMHDKGVINHNHAAEEAEISEKLQKVISLQNTADSINSAELTAAIDSARDSILSSQLSAQRKNEYSILLTNSKPESRLNFLERVQTEGSIIGDNLAQLSQNAKFLATPLRDKISNQNLRFISDVNVQGEEVQKAYTDYVQGIKGKLRPIARIDSMHQRQIGLGVESNSNSGIQKLSSMFAVALHSSLDSSFAQTSLTIKGDPFWLFPQPIDNVNSKIYNSLKPLNEAIDWIKNAQFRMRDAVNIYGSDNFIIIRFRTPRDFEIDHNTNSDGQFTDVETFSGVFKVVTVISKFENGKFIQELSCIIDPNINILNFMDEIETNAAVINTSTSPNDLILTNTIPINNIKTQRIR